MVNYGFYRDQYAGNAVTAEEWHTLAVRAQSQLDKYKRIYTVTPPEETSEAMAVCAMVDALAYFIAAQNGTGTVASASIGSVSVSYGNAGNAVDVSPKAQERELFRCACQHLQISRGVG